jgi:putative phosphonate metabolism protein
MANFPRYAIYFVPAPDSDIYRFGAHALGYDAFSGETLGFPDGVTQFVPDWHDLTQEARKYGFHATLKAPFALAARSSEAELAAACEAFAGSARRIAVINPVVRPIGDFIALVPDRPSAALNALAQDCVETFDHFRAPLSADDRTRRNPAALTPRQLEYLDRWGYPYVGDEFRFHMTLTGRISAERRPAIVAMLRDRFSPYDGLALSIDRIALVRQDDASSRFRVMVHNLLLSQAAIVS